MALLDRLKDAARPSNSIEAVEPQPTPASATATASRPNTEAVAVSAPPGGQQPTSKKADAKAAAYTTEPETIAKSYYVEERGNERRYYDDYQRKSLAIRADNSSISSKKEDLNTVRSMLDLAEARGWSEVKINGSADFKREMWIEAQARGLQAQGYKASDLDRQEADRRRAERPQSSRSEPSDMNVVTPARQAGEAVVERPQQAPANDRSSASSARQEPSEPTRRAEPLHSAKVGAAQTPDQQPARGAPAARQDGSPKPSQPAEPLHSAKVSTPAPGDQQQAKATGSAPDAVSPSLAESRRSLREAKAELSPDGRLILEALSENVDRKMNKLNAEGKAEMKAFAAAELVKKERAEGPIVLSAEQRQVAAAPEPARQQTAEPVLQEAQASRPITPEEPRRSRSR